MNPGRNVDAAYILPEKTHIGATTLYVQNLNRMKDFYTNQVGLKVIAESGNEAFLGHNDNVVIHLIQNEDISRAMPGSAGLYHNAILFSERSALANAVKRILEQTPERFEGTSDHKVSEAFYFNDPEANGLELYFDKNPSSWEWIDGKIQMGSEYIDPMTYIETYADSQDSDSNKTVMGHIHLRVGDIPKAKEFYTNVLGFEITSEMPTALFVSAGGYHHHIGMNVWESQGAGIRGETLGLKTFEIKIPSNDEIKYISERLKNKNITYSFDENILKTQDPWGNGILISSFN